jgi:hypothetical protein
VTGGMTNDELMRSLREITGSLLDPQFRHHVEAVERAGSHVTVYEVIETGDVLVIAHSAPRPSMTAIRRAFEQNSHRLKEQS